MWGVEDAMSAIILNNAYPITTITYAGASDPYLEKEAVRWQKYKPGDKRVQKIKPEIEFFETAGNSKYTDYINHLEKVLIKSQTFSGGFLGVDIFFVISGYLITSIILKELVTTGSFSFKYFYERRVRRILPALLVVMIVSLPFAWMYFIPSSFIDFSKSILYSLGFSSNSANRPENFWRRKHSPCNFLIRFRQSLN